MSSTSSQLNPTSFKNTILRAGAGAGKTTTLTQTFLKFADDFKQKQTKFPRIVVTTFTRKATQELKERLLKKALEDEREDLFHYVNSRSQVQISTIHGVLSVFLARYGSAIGLTPDYRLLNDLEIKRNARKIIRKHVLENSDLQELLEEYDFQVLESALLNFFSERIRFPDLKFITEFELENETKKLFKDLSKEILRVADAIEFETSNEKWKDYAASIRTFQWSVSGESHDDFCTRLKTFWDFLAKPQFRKASAPFSLSVNEEWEELRKKLDDFLDKSIHKAIFWNKHQVNCDLFETLAQRFFKDFLKSKIELGLLSMSDLENLTYKIIKESPESAQKFSLEWDFWMVDEYQDTSPIQVEILKSLIGEKPLFVVGDPQQSIYLFRGARSEVFEEKVDEVRGQCGDVQVKLVNYRSSPEVLNFFNFYFTKLGPQFAAMTPDPKKVLSEVSEPVVQVLITDDESKNQEKQNNFEQAGESNTKIAELSNEISAVIARIQELLAEGVNPEQICVLSRTHRTLEEIAKFGQMFGVPLQLHSGSGFFERREVLDALCILKFLVNPHDNANFVALFRSPWLAVTDSELIKFCHSGINSYWTEVKKVSHSDQHPFSIALNLQKIAEENGFSWALKTAMVNLGIFQYSAQIDSTGRREANLWKVISVLNSEERRPGFNFLDFLDSSLETLSTDEGGEDSDATPVVEPKRVNFMTVHASKGLQFEHVLLPGMGKSPRASNAPMICFHEKTGQWTLKLRNPQTQAFEGSLLAEQITAEIRERESEEFNRVLYVALTRAKSGVTLFWDQGSKKKSWAERCPLDLMEGLHEEVGFSYLVRKDNPQPKKESQYMAELNLVRDIFSSSSSVQTKKHLSVTDIISDDIGTAASLTSKASVISQNENKVSFNEINAEKELTLLNQASQGTEAHKIFESVKYLGFQKAKSIADLTLQSSLDFLESTELLPLTEIIHDGHVEWGFALNFESTMIQGQIDLWGSVNETLWLVDYKTGSQRHLQKAFKQLEVYAWALHRMGYAADCKTIKMAVIYPMDKVVRVEELRLDCFDQIEKKISSL
jgi:ATP-dependent helicase/nuclease subunit A